jgi:hypothetical protein
MHRWTTHGKKRRSALPAEAGVATVKGRHGRLRSPLRGSDATARSAWTRTDEQGRVKPPTPVLRVMLRRVNFARVRFRFRKNHLLCYPARAEEAVEGHTVGRKTDGGFDPALTLNWRSSLVSKPATVNNLPSWKVRQSHPM